MNGDSMKKVLPQLEFTDFRDLCVLIDSRAILEKHIRKENPNRKNDFIKPAAIITDITGRAKLSNLREFRLNMKKHFTSNYVNSFTSKASVNNFLFELEEAEETNALEQPDLSNSSLNRVQRIYALEQMSSAPNLASLVEYFHYFSLDHAELLVIPTTQNKYLYKSDQSKKTLTEGLCWFDLTADKLVNKNLTDLKRKPIKCMSLHELVEYRNRSKISQTDIAAAMGGHSPSYVSKIESKIKQLKKGSLLGLGNPSSAAEKLGNSNLNINTIIKYAETIGFTLFIYFKTHEQKFVYDGSNFKRYFELPLIEGAGLIDDGLRSEKAYVPPKDYVPVVPFCMLDAQPKAEFNGTLSNTSICGDEVESLESQQQRLRDIALSHLLNFLELGMLTEDLLPHMPMDYGTSRSREEKLEALKKIHELGLLPRPWKHAPSGMKVHIMSRYDGWS